jgi:hypothetical protein
MIGHGVAKNLLIDPGCPDQVVKRTRRQQCQTSKRIVAMHGSTPCFLVIDRDERPANLRSKRDPTPDDRHVSPGYVPGEIRLLLQRVAEGKIVKTRLDIEADALVAQVLGARKRRTLPDSAWGMEDRCSSELCVSAPETPGFPDRAKTKDAR